MEPEKDAYVYLIIDPTTKDPDGFYIGKGTGYRDRSHLKPSVWKNPKNTVNPFLYFKIKSLMENNTPPIIKRIVENISEEQAYEYENDYIKKHGRRFVDGWGKLFNISDCKGGPVRGVPKPWTQIQKVNYRKFCKTLRIYDPTYEELYEDFTVKGKTRKQISEENGCSDALVKKRLKELQVKKPKTVRYPPKNKWQCVCCGRKFLTPNSVKKRKYCSKNCYRKKND